MLRATKARLYPTLEQRHSLSFQFGAVRWIYNFSLDMRRKAWKERGERIGKNETMKNLVFLKKAEATSWLKEADGQILQQSLHHLGLAFQRFFRKQGGYPCFKSKRGQQTLSYPQRVKVLDERTLYLPKVGDVRCVLHRTCEGQT